MAYRQEYLFSFCDTLLAEVGNITLDKLHFDVDAIVRAHENIIPIAERLNVEAPKPGLAGFSYTHLAALGAKIVFPEDSEPIPLPLLHSAEEIEQLTEPDDYLAAPEIQRRLTLLRELMTRCPEARNDIGGFCEGPITTAVLMMGPDFLLLSQDRPAQAHRLLQFCVRSALNYTRVICEYLGLPIEPGPGCIADDFAGLFRPGIFEQLVVPYWEEMYEGLHATERNLHSELLHVEHLPFLRELRIDSFDPSADQYLTTELLHKHCPCKFLSRFRTWQVHNLSATELEKLYRKESSFGPRLITFGLAKLEDEPKIQRLLDVARELKGESD